MVDLKWRIAVTLSLLLSVGLCAHGADPVPGPVTLRAESDLQQVRKDLEDIGQRNALPTGPYNPDDVVEMKLKDVMYPLNLAQTLLNRAEWKRTFVKVEMAKTEELANALKSYDVYINPIPSLRMLAIAGPTDAVDEVVMLAKELDASETGPAPQPAPTFNNLEVVVHFLQAFSSEDQAAPLIKSRAIASQGPEGMHKMADVIAELTPLYGDGLKYFALLESAAARVSLAVPKVEIRGMLPSALDELHTSYFVNLSVGQINTDTDGPRVRLDEVKIGTEAPFISDASKGITYRSFGFESAFTVPAEKMVVVGKANLDNSLNPIFIVMEVRPLD